MPIYNDIFDKKSDFYKDRNSVYNENGEKKNALIEHLLKIEEVWD